MKQGGEALSPTVVSFINIFASTSVAMICTIEEASPSIRAKQDDTGTKKIKLVIVNNMVCHTCPCHCNATFIVIIDEQ